MNSRFSLGSREFTGKELWLPSAMVEKQSLTDDEAVPQKKKKVKIPSYLSREPAKGKSHIHKIQARNRCNVRTKNCESQK